ncbi:GNAT family N-acetyltransferase [Robertmurraya andreesenii]|uniref:GNAT superfamily N-acetyltransferase n=1 Tax=Anoxybacillus andreesenii TaxID=1325932 RepID=A0ABT9V7J7_9BACL|nr:GNAT family N-acetyltransferase [Robertmurraya andreesenii]MDQ0156904.1 GNAT superfamily N-acetyltransferase [Robertmurraya andreesenii]
MEKFIMLTPWDEKIFGIKTYEIIEYNEKSLEQIINLKGHFTIKSPPLSNKSLLHKYGFYYVDTLLEPFCKQQNLIKFEDSNIQISKEVNLEDILPICNGAFVYGRFHKDFNLPDNLCDNRYNTWLREMYYEDNVFGIYYNGDIAGFFGYREDKILLHALSDEYRGKGLGKYFWYAAYDYLFNKGYKVLSSSVSASNLAIVNLYISLGFKFRNPLEVYHKYVE